MNTSEHEEHQEAPPQDIEPYQEPTATADAPHAGAPVSEEHPTEAEPAEEPPAPVEPAEPGIYDYEADDPSEHPVLGRLMPGANDFTEETHPEKLMALGALVASGQMRKSESEAQASDQSPERSG